MRRKPQIVPRIVGLVVVWVLAFLLVGLLHTAEAARHRPLTERQRYGFVATVPDWPQKFDVVQLNAGWYVDATLPGCALAPGGMERALLIPVQAGYTVDAHWLGPFVDSHPASTWLIGNEPDCIWQDNVLPEEYARIYHELYAFIKSRDPTSLLSPGGIVQPTPLRLEWLDRVLAAYVSDYGQAMPVDVWNIHNAILNEERGGWGADIPPGITASVGAIRNIDDNDNMAIFEAQIRAFRQWMADNGYGGYPLLVTEYGVLMPDDYGFDADRVNAFMSATFDFFENAAGPLGDPADGYRLVQRWAWFSLDIQPWDPVTGEGFNGNLLDPDTQAITGHGLRYASHTESFGALSYVDLVLSAVHTLPAFDLAGPGQPVSRTLQVEVANEGTVEAGSFSVMLEIEGVVHEQSIAALPAASSEWVTFALTGLLPGVHPFTISIDPGDQVTESTECNNQVASRVLAPTDRTFLPAVASQGLLRGAASAREALPSQLLVSNWPFVARQSRLQLSALHKADSFAQTAMPSVGQHQSLGPQPLSLLTMSQSSRVSGFREYSVPTADSYPAQLALDPVRQVLWVTQRDGNKLAAFDLSTETWIGEYVVPTPDSEPWGLAVDGSGNVWFAETAVDKIGVLNVATGEISEPAILVPGKQPWAVALSGTGQNLTVWFTERAGSSIGKFVPATGEMVTYTLPTTDAQPSGIAVHGNDLWFTETAADRLGFLNIQTGEIREFKSGGLAPPLEGPQDVAVGSSGNPWLTEAEGDRITLFYFSTLQNFVPIALAGSGREPYGITVQGDQAIWFTERAGNRLGRYTGIEPPSEYRLPTPASLPTDIVVDVAGCAWYTAPGANQIGRLCLPFKVYLPTVLRDQGLVGGR